MHTGKKQKVVLRSGARVTSVYVVHNHDMTRNDGFGVVDNDCRSWSRQRNRREWEIKHKQGEEPRNYYIPAVGAAAVIEYTE
jgi:hypothetical protein